MDEVVGVIVEFALAFRRAKRISLSVVLRKELRLFFLYLPETNQVRVHAPSLAAGTIPSDFHRDDSEAAPTFD